MRFFSPKILSYYRTLLLVLILTRAPIVKFVQSAGSWGRPIIQHLWKVLLPASISVGPLNAQTGATDDIILELAPGFDNTAGFVGEELEIKIFARDLLPGIYQVTGRLPPGMTLTDVDAFGIVTITGVPEQAGRWRVSVSAWQSPSMDGPESSPIDITIVIRESGPVITQQPAKTIQLWGEPLTLEVSVQNEGGVSYSWYKNGELIPLVDSRMFHLSQVTSDDAGSYHAVVSDSSGQTESEPAEVSVVLSEYDRWRETNFPDSLAASADPNADPDFDAIPNRFEQLLGSSPLTGNTEGYPIVTYERSDETTYLVCEFKENPLGADEPALIERKVDLAAASWAPIELSDSSLLTEEGEGYFRIKIPFAGRSFLRFRFSEE